MMMMMIRQKLQYRMIDVSIVSQTTVMSLADGLFVLLATSILNLSHAHLFKGWRHFPMLPLRIQNARKWGGWSDERRLRAFSVKRVSFRQSHRCVACNRDFVIQHQYCTGTVVQYCYSGTVLYCPVSLSSSFIRGSNMFVGIEYHLYPLRRLSYSDA